VGWLESRRIPVLFAIATLLPIAALCWLGFRTLEQGRDLERQWRRERLEVAAGRVALDIEKDLQQLEATLGDGDGIRFVPTRIVPPAGDSLLFRPDVPAVSIGTSSQLIAAAQQEERAPREAIAAYRRIAAMPADPDRGEALVALGALLRRQRQFDEALAAYRELETLAAVPVAGGQPAALVARQGRAKVFLESGDPTRLREEALALAQTIHTGRWLIDRASFEMYQDEMIKPWGGPPADAQAIVRADGVAELWRLWLGGELGPRGRRFVGGEGTSALAVWVAGAEGPLVAVLPPHDLHSRWRRLWEARGLTGAVAQADGRPVFGAVVDEVELSPAKTGLPFFLGLAAGPDAPASDDVVRRRVVIGGVVLACALMIAASYGLYRITARELLLARQQSDFVAAVSHEFRTPLTSMRHLLDLLVTRGVTDENRKTQYYGLLAGETDRLQRMVETLLSFGRMDAAAHVWKLEPLNVAELVGAVADAFGREIIPRSLVTDLDPRLPTIRGDRDALERALWNLLENAAKYSPPETPIRLFARRERAAVVIGVQDHGIGIPVAEQQRVFQKFVRGDEAKRAGIRGVGVGLALVKRIAEAHGGRVRLASQVGAGSTFTLVLPVTQ
jgi:signal transduction histidine kinase